MASFVFTVLGPDQPGLVEQLAGLVSQHGGNWERSRMARLGGRFAGIVEVVVPDDQGRALRDALGALTAATGLSVTVDEAGEGPVAAGHHVVVSLVGSDRSGLVHSVTTALVDAGANIEELTTATTSAPMSGGPLFEATVTAVLPPSTSVHAVRRHLESLADRLMVDIDLTD